MTKLFVLLNPTPPVGAQKSLQFAEAAAAPNMNLICVLHMNDALTGNFAALDYILSVLQPESVFRINMMGMPVDTKQTTYRTTSFITSYVDSPPAPLVQPVIWDAGFSDPVQGAFPNAFVKTVAYIRSKGLISRFHGFGFNPCSPSLLDGEFTIISRFTDANHVKHDYSNEVLALGYTEEKVIQALVNIYTGVEQAAPGLHHRFSWFVPAHQRLGYTPDPQCTFAHSIWQAMINAVPNGLLTPINQVMTATSTLGYTETERAISQNRLCLQTGTEFKTYDQVAPVIANCNTYKPLWIEVHPNQAIFASEYMQGFSA